MNLKKLLSALSSSARLCNEGVTESNGRGQFSHPYFFSIFDFEAWHASLTALIIPAKVPSHEEREAIDWSIQCFFAQHRHRALHHGHPSQQNPQFPVLNIRFCYLRREQGGDMNPSIDDLSLERDDCLRCASRSLNRASEGGGRLGVVRRSGLTHFFFLSPLVMQHISIRLSPPNGGA